MKVNITVLHMGKTVDKTVLIYEDEYDIIHGADTLTDYLLEQYHEIKEGFDDVSDN